MQAGTKHNHLFVSHLEIHTPFNKPKLMSAEYKYYLVLYRTRVTETDGRSSTAVNRQQVSPYVTDILGCFMLIINSNKLNNVN